MSRADPTPVAVRPSGPYLAALGFGVTAIPFGIIALRAISLMQAGRDQTMALDTSSMPAAVLAYGLLFLDRIVFWPKASAALRAGVRWAIVLVLVASLVLTSADIVLLFSTSAGRPAAASVQLAPWFTTLAALCQVAAAIWLVRYRKDGVEGTRL